MTWFEELDKRIRAELPELRTDRDEPMSRHTSFRIGGPARRIAYPSGAGQLTKLLRAAQECGARPLVIGNGTNLLVPDAGLDRLVVETSDGMNHLSAEQDCRIRAESGVSLAHLADFAQRRGLAGLEFAHGIPGTVGGGCCMNAGAYGGEIRQTAQSVVVLDSALSAKRLDGGEMDFGYRRSILTDHPDWVVLEAVFALEPGDPDAIRARMKELMARRKASQPLEYPSAGSTFKRPEGYFAGTLIDQCGLKGLTVGGAQVSEKHAGFLINRGGATFSDVLELIELVQERVFRETGVQLEPEVRIIR